jgi:hypothetical protein
MIPDTDWQAMTDGRVWRLKLGQDVHEDMRELQRTAAAVASDAGKTVAILRDDLGKNRYIWVQFADQELAPGQPCACGSLEFDTRGGLPRCASCGRTALRRASADPPPLPLEPEPEPEPDQPDDDVDSAGDEQRDEVEVETAEPAPPKPAPPKPAPPTAMDINAVGQAMRGLSHLDIDRRRLEAYTDVHLSRHAGSDVYERFSGWARHPNGTEVLLLVDYPLRAGKRLPDPRHPGEPLYRLIQWPMSPFADILDTPFPPDPDEPGNSSTP